MTDILDLRSDTFSVPCPGMRKAISEADVGDDVFGEDPSVNALEAETAELTGKEAGLFVPSGTMGNGLGIRVLTEPGDQVICGSSSHVYNYEGGQFSLNCALQMHRIDEDPDGTIPVQKIEEALSIREDIHRAPRTLLALENTHNLLGGAVLPQCKVLDACAVAYDKGLYTYLDGARLWHASVASKTPLTVLAEPFNMVSVCYSKALGAPVGSVLTGTIPMIDMARWYRKRMGGGMRQAGILAAACRYALKNNLPKLGITHEYALRLAEAFVSTGRFHTALENVKTNMVFLETETDKADAAVEMLAGIGIRVLALNRSSVRMVTHLSLDPRQIDRAIERIAKEL